MSSDPLELKEAARAEYHARWEAVEIFKAHELAAMAEERARQIIQTLEAVEGWRERPDWAGLVEKPAIFREGRGGGSIWPGVSDEQRIAVCGPPKSRWLGGKW